MAKILDACGLSCPAPVLLVKDTLESSSEQMLTVLVDNDASRENVSRFLGSKGYDVKSYEEEGKFKIEALLDENALVDSQTDSSQTQEAAIDPPSKVVVMITTDRLGSGDDTLGKKLMISYVKTLKEMGDDLWHVILVNGGVRLTIDTSPVLSELQELEEGGVIVLACGTCLEHFGLSSAKRVGTTTNMLDIVMATQLANKVINIG